MEDFVEIKVEKEESPFLPIHKMSPTQKTQFFQLKSAGWSREKIVEELLIDC